MINPIEVTSLIRLLDDPDGEIFEHVHHKLLSFGNEAIEYLELAWEKAFNPVLQELLKKTCSFGTRVALLICYGAPSSSTATNTLTLMNNWLLTR